MRDHIICPCSERSYADTCLFHVERCSAIQVYILIDLKICVYHVVYLIEYGILHKIRAPFSNAFFAISFVFKYSFRPGLCFFFLFIRKMRFNKRWAFHLHEAFYLFLGFFLHFFACGTLELFKHIFWSMLLFAFIRPFILTFKDGSHDILIFQMQDILYDTRSDIR